MKKMLFGTLLWMFTLAWVAVLPNYASATGETTEYSDSRGRANPQAAENMVAEDGKQTLTWASLLDTIRNAINWVLGILATIALVICLYWGFLMVASAGDEKKYWEWLKVLKNAAIGLAIIWLSWMIVSIVFWFIGTLWWKNQSAKWNVNGSSTIWSLDDWGTGTPSGS